MGSSPGWCLPSRGLESRVMVGLAVASHGIEPRVVPMQATAKQGFDPKRLKPTAYIWRLALASVWEATVRC